MLQQVQQEAELGLGQSKVEQENGTDEMVQCKVVAVGWIPGPGLLARSAGPKGAVKI